MAYGDCIYDAETITIAGHGDNATDIWDAIRNGHKNSVNVRVRLRENDKVHLIKNMNIGEFIKIRISRVYQTGTTAARVEVYRLK